MKLPIQIVNVNVYTHLHTHKSMKFEHPYNKLSGAQINTSKTFNPCVQFQYHSWLKKSLYHRQ